VETEVIRRHASASHGIALALLLAALAAAPLADAGQSRTHSGGSSSHSSAHSPGKSGGHAGGHSTSSSHGHSKATGVPRDPHGKIKRSEVARHDFRKSHPCPSTGKSSGSCPGYVIDHVTPLKRGGADSPNNMQWQTQADAKRKDRTE
jgi:hypothetical protein